MATLRDIKRRIRSVESTQKITKAMKLVAAAKLRRAQERVIGARPYAQKMGELLGSLVSRVGDDGHPLLVRRTGARKRLVVITADKGLCGAFNSNVIRAATHYLRDGDNVDVTLVVVGKKSRDFFRRRQWPVKSEMLGFFDRLAYSHAQELAGGLMADYLAGETDEVHLIYNEFRSVAVQRVTQQQLLPIQADAVAGAGDAAAGEFGARMTAMEAASKNAKEMIGVLTIQYNKARQERITKELLDIVGGAEALRQATEA
jgi:F-type H+-transporting ATPase subunit gamma